MLTATIHGPGVPPPKISAPSKTNSCLRLCLATGSVGVYCCSILVSLHVIDAAVVFVSDYRSVGVAGSLAGGRVTSGTRQRDTSARDTRGSTHSLAARPAKPLLLAYLLYTAAAAAACTVTSRGVASVRRHQHFL